jgi:hypothetical protein
MILITSRRTYTVKKILIVRTTVSCVRIARVVSREPMAMREPEVLNGAGRRASAAGRRALR